MTDISRRSLLASAILPVGILIAFLAIQEQRNGWPFAPGELARDAHSTALAVDESALADGSSPDSAAARVTVKLPANQVEMLSMQLETVELRKFDDPVRAVAIVVADESRLVHVHTRVAGWLEALYVNTTGEQVRAGQPLGAVFSQELYSSQMEYLSALRRASSGPASAVLEAARTRLTLLGMSAVEIARIKTTGKVRRLVTITAPRSGVVMNRGVSEGTAVDPSTEILTLVDLTVLWVIAEIAQADAVRVGAGTEAKLTFPASGREPFTAKVQFVYPTLTERARTVRVRMAVANADGILRPGMYGSAVFPVGVRNGLTVGRDAVVDTGKSQHVFVQSSRNVFEPRKVKLGARLGDRVEILQGLTAGERVVTAGVFLIDSESRLRASGGTGHSGHGGTAGAASDTQDGDTPADEPAHNAHQP